MALCIVAGIGLGTLVLGLFAAIGGTEVAKVNLPVAGPIWLMIVPLLLGIDFVAPGPGRPLPARDRHHPVRQLGRKALPQGAPGLALHRLALPALPAGQIDSYIAGLIILAAAPCTAMVLVWSNLTWGKPHFTLSRVALSGAIMVVAFARIVGLLLGLSTITVPWATLVLSVVLYIVVPVIGTQTLRRRLLASGGPAAFDAVLRRVQPLSLVALLATLVLLFGFQGVRSWRSLSSSCSSRCRS